MAKVVEVADNKNFILVTFKVILLTKALAIAKDLFVNIVLSLS